VTTLARKYRSAPEGLPTVIADFEAKLAELPSEDSIAALADTMAKSQAAFTQSAARLSAARRKAATGLAAQVGRALAPLAMVHARLEAELKPHAEPHPDGAESVEFLWSANVGSALAPLARSASGGELSRLGLALQTVLGHALTVPTLIFDEVDTGIGGAVADAVGQSLARLAAQMVEVGGQVLCVTHLAPVAAYADHQLRVEKAVVNQDDAARTISRIEPLTSADARVEEIARMLGGATVTAATRKAARELLAAGRSESRSRSGDGDTTNKATA
jgi:DNA repair protein RecN (Recombination protein N)